MEITWLVVANRSRARILEVRARNEAPREAADFVNPAGRVHERDLDSDAAGRFYGKGEREQGHSAPPGESQAEHEVDRFTVELREFLDRARIEKRFAHLWLIAAPAFLGQLRNAFHKPLRHCVELEIDKDLTTDKPDDILRRAIDAKEAKALAHSARTSAR